MTADAIPHRTDASGLRVVHLSAPAPFGGLESVVAMLSSAQRTLGLDVSVLAVLEPGASVPDAFTALPSAGVDLVVLRCGQRDYRGERRAVAAEINSRGSPVLHCHGYRPDIVHGNTIRNSGHVVVSTVHGFTRRGIRGRFNEFLQLRALRQFDGVIAVSRTLGAELTRRGVPSGGVEVIPNALGPDRAGLLSRAEARSALDLPQDAPVIGWVGRFSAEKDPRTLLDAFTRLRDSRVFLCMLGSGPLHSAVLRTALSLGVADRVRLPGNVPHAASYVTAFDVMALSSITEGTPVVLLEAGIADVPVVATSVGGVPDLVGPDGLLVPPKDADSLARALEAALTDRHRAIVRARRFSARLEDMGTHGWVAKHVALYLRATERHIARARERSTSGLSLG